MNRNEFIETLTKKLRENNISDIDEIIAEYEEHFNFKLSDGYSEEEIAALLGNPEEIALQYTPGNVDNKTGGKKAIIITGLVFADIFAGAFFALFFTWIILMGAFTIASATIGMCYIGRFNIYSLIPPVPYYWCGIVYAVMFLSLAVLSGIGTIYCVSYCRQLMRAYGRFHKNCIESASGKAMLPPLHTHPKFSAKTHRMLRGIALIMLAVFAVTFVLAYVLSAIAAGALEFWHEWNWFMK
ncbi:MAG: DUF1700 domain-containing protein [Acetivibrionales bacterium]|jgi:uncharacterized membrane protein